MKLSDFKALFNILKPAPSRNSSGRGLFDEEEQTKELSNQEAQKLLDTILAYYKEKQGYIVMTDLLPLLKMAGRNRVWLHNEVMTRVSDFRLVYDETRSRYEIMI